MLDEQEWTQIFPLLASEDARLEYFDKEDLARNTKKPEDVTAVPALAKYNELTGFFESNITAIWHHRLSLYGPECRNCGRLIRTPKARFCVECGVRTEIDIQPKGN